MEGKTIQQILDETSQRLFGFDDFNRALMEVGDRCTEGQMCDIIGISMHDYAHQQCELQKVECFTNSKLYISNPLDDSPYTQVKLETYKGSMVTVDKQSILTAKNMCDAQ